MNPTVQMNCLGKGEILECWKYCLVFKKGKQEDLNDY